MLLELLAFADTSVLIDGGSTKTGRRNQVFIIKRWAFAGSCMGYSRLILGICLLVYSGRATVMFGQLLGRVPDAFSLMADFHFIYAVIVVLSFVCALLRIVAGVGLLANQVAAREPALAAAIFSVSEIPFGTMLGIFTLVALLPVRGSFAPARA